MISTSLALVGLVLGGQTGDRLWSPEFGVAFNKGDVAEMRRLLEKGEKLRQPRNERESTFICDIARSSRFEPKVLIEMIELAKRYGPKLTRADQGLGPQLMYHQDETIAAFVRAGIDLHFLSADGTALKVALDKETYNASLSRGRYPRSRYYYRGTVGIARFTDPNRPVNARGTLPLNTAAWHGRLAVVEVLLNKGAKLEHANERGETPLFAASMTESPEHASVVRFLRRRGAKTNVRDVDGQTPLDFARQKKFKLIEKALTEKL